MKCRCFFSPHCRLFVSEYNCFWREETAFCLHSLCSLNNSVFSLFLLNKMSTENHFLAVLELEICVSASTVKPPQASAGNKTKYKLILVVTFLYMLPRIKKYTFSTHNSRYSATAPDLSSRSHLTCELAGKVSALTWLDVDLLPSTGKPASLQKERPFLFIYLLTPFNLWSHMVVIRFLPFFHL